MKGKTITLVIVGGITFAGLAYIASKILMSKEKQPLRVPRVEVTPPLDFDKESKKNVDEREVNLFDIRSNAANSISERHKASAEIMKELLNNVLRTEPIKKNQETGNEGSFSAMFDELNDLVK